MKTESFVPQKASEALWNSYFSEVNSRHWRCNTIFSILGTELQRKGPMGFCKTVGTDGKKIVIYTWYNIKAMLDLTCSQRNEIRSPNHWLNLEDVSPLFSDWHTVFVASWKIGTRSRHTLYNYMFSLTSSPPSSQTSYQIIVMSTSRNVTLWMSVEALVYLHS